MKRFIALTLALMISLSLAACAKKPLAEDKYPIVTMELEGGVVEMTLYPNSAPNTVANFVALIQSGFYDGLTFHRAVPGFIVQGGSPDGTGSGRIDYSIAGEFIANKFTDNRLKHDRGTLSMARSESYDSAGSQFFICLSDGATGLDGLYAAFGKVTSGMEYIDAIAALPAANQLLLSRPVITKITVETFGVKYKVQKTK